MDITMTGLTELELKVLRAARTNCYGDIMEHPQWSFGVCDESRLDEKVYRGVVTSLIKKGLVEIWDYEGKEKYEDMMFELTDKGKKIYSDYSEYYEVISCPT